MKILTVLFFFLAFGVGAGFAADGNRYGILHEIKGGVFVRIGGAEWQPAQPGMILHEKDEIRTDKGGSAEIHLDQEADTGKLELKESSYMRLNTLAFDPQGGDKTTLLDLALGKILVRAEKLQGNSKFEVRTPTSTTGVRGTVFEVQIEENE